MHVRHLQVSDFRSWELADLELEPGASVLVGRNGQGKTNLVEAIGYVATLGSHRVSSDAPLIRHGAQRAVVRTAVVNDDRELLVELEITAGKSNRARINRVRCHVRVMCSGSCAPCCSHRRTSLVRGDPSDRRRFLDEMLVLRAPRSRAFAATTTVSSSSAARC